MRERESAHGFDVWCVRACKKQESVRGCGRIRTVVLCVFRPATVYVRLWRGFAQVVRQRMYVCVRLSMLCSVCAHVH